MGTEGGGNMFPGVCMPYGVAKFGIDVLPPSGAGDAYSGYHALGKVLGFSMMHESGTGGAPKYGVVSQHPVVGVLDNPLADHTLARTSADEAGLGWYRASLEGVVKVELAASHHSGIIKHTFGASVNTTSAERHVLVDVSHYLQSFRGQGIGQNYVEGQIKVSSNGNYEGFGVYNGGWNLGKLPALESRVSCD
jgi:putative alpha-1,2-mannosidase